jgi:cell fate (sporulation/competence/biofilm development) regulator YlbF (YheA/YmcA/DUF963 family)
MSAAVIEMAKRLGRSIAESPAAAAMRTARKELEGQADLKQVIEDYQKQVAKIANLERQGKPVEVDDKQRLRGLNEKLVASEVFKRYTAAQVDYLDLMRKVNDTIRRELAEVEK